MFTANQLSANGLDQSRAQAIASATAGLTLQQWLQLLQAILAAIGPVLKPPIP